MIEKVKQEMNIMLGVVEGVQKFLKEDRNRMALMLSDALFSQYWKVRDGMKKPHIIEFDLKLRSSTMIRKKRIIIKIMLKSSTRFPILLMDN